jgi:hypothetical protein
VIDIGTADTARFPAGKAYIVIAAGDETVSGLDVLAIPDSAARVRLVRDAYAFVRRLANAKTGSRMNEGGRAYAKLNPVLYPVIDAVREKMEPYFSETGISQTLKSLDVISRRGNLWISADMRLPALRWPRAAERPPEPGQHSYETKLTFQRDNSVIALRAEIEATRGGWRVGSAIEVKEKSQDMPL